MVKFPILLALLTLGAATDSLNPGEQIRSVQVGESSRTYRLYVPASYDPDQPSPLVLALHPFATNGAMMASLSGLRRKADQEGFLVAFPDGSGRGTLLRWNVGLRTGDGTDDVGFIREVLDDLASIARVDPKRVFATGYSNGGMLCYRLASELSDRIAAIAPVAGTMIGSEIKANRPVPVLHFHGTKDSLVSYKGKIWRQPNSSRPLGVEESVLAWAEHNGCPQSPATTLIPRDADDDLVIRRLVFGPGQSGSEVVLYKIEGGGHTWPGQPPIWPFLGGVALDLKANDLIWEFFQKHPMP